MKQTTQPAEAPESKGTDVFGLLGTSWSIEARTSDGRAITTLMRMQYQLSPTVDGKIAAEIEDRFYRFYCSVEDLF